MSNSVYSRDRIDAIASRLGALTDEAVLANPRLDSGVARAEGVRYATRVASVAALHGEIEYPEYPRIVPMASLWWSWGFNNPDTDYRYANIDGAHTYRLFGHRGTARIYDIEIWSGNMKDFRTVHHFSAARNMQLDPHGPFASSSDFAVDADGNFDIILSATEQPGNWIQLPEGVATILTREMFYDWDNERRSETYFERVGATYPPPPVTEADIDNGLDATYDFLDNIEICAQGVAIQHDSLEPNTMSAGPMDMGQRERGQADHLALRDIRFLHGHYQCPPGQALIIEAPYVECDYWNYYLNSHNWESGDFDHRQSSLNGTQAVIDPDGVFRAVLAARDPGVPNWLDTGGRSSGLILARYLTAGEVPQPKFTAVPLEDVADHLPDTTPVVSAQERSETLRRRMHSVRRRLLQG